MKIALLIFLLCFHASAAQWYVRTDGSDSNTGSADTAGGAKLTLDGALSIGTLAGGDTINVGAGTFTGTANTDVDGSAGNPILIVGQGTNSTIISGKVTVDKSFYTFRNMSIRGLLVEAPQHDIIVEFCELKRALDILKFSSGSSNCIARTNHFSHARENSMFDVGGAYHLIEGNTFVYNNGNDVHRINNLQDTIFRGNTYNDIRSSPSEPTTSTTSVTIGTGTKVFTVADSGLTNYWVDQFVHVSSAADSANDMTGWVVSYSGTTLTLDVVTTGGSGTFSDWNINTDSSGNHADIWQYFDSSGVTPGTWFTRRIIWERNLIKNSSCQIANGSADNLSTNFHDHIFRGNVVVSNRLYWNSSASNMWVYNNTFYNCESTTSGILNANPRVDEVGGSLRVFNNVFCKIGGTESAGVYAIGGGGGEGDYNLITDFADDSAKTGYSEANGINGGYTPSQIFTDPAGGNFEPILAALANGTNLFSTVGEITLYDGTVLGAGGNWPMGAASGGGVQAIIATNNASGSRVSGFRNLAMAVSPVTPHNHPASPLLFENFEGTGYSTAGWEEYLAGSGNSIDPDNTTNVLSGSQSLAIVGISDDPSCITNSFAASSEVFGYFEFQCLKYPSEDGDAYRQVMRLETEDGTTLFHLLMFNTGTLYIQTGAASDGALAGPLSLGQTYHVWWSWNKNNGSNSEATIAYSTTKVKPTSGDTFVSITGSTIAEDATRIMVGYDNTSSELDLTLGGLFNGAPSWIYDYLILDDVEIPNYP